MKKKVTSSFLENSENFGIAVYRKRYDHVATFFHSGKLLEIFFANSSVQNSFSFGFLVG